MKVGLSETRQCSRSGESHGSGGRQTEIVCSGIDSKPLEARSSIYQFVYFLLSASPLPISLPSGESFAGNKQRRSGTPDPWLPGNHTLSWWSGGNFRGLCENSINVVIKPESLITHTLHTHTQAHGGWHKHTHVNTGKFVLCKRPSNDL